MPSEPERFGYAQAKWRDLVAVNSMTFDATYYLEQNPDVFAAVLRGETTAEQHFNTYGWQEGRDPNAFFDTSFYLLQYPDVLNARVNPFQHFLANGAGEGRFTNANQDNVVDFTGNNLANEFDAEAYLAANPDVDAAIPSSFTSAYEHYVLFGQFEGRAGAQLTDGTQLSGPFSSDGTSGTGIDPNAPTNPGQTFTLTEGADTIQGQPGNLTGSNGDVDTDGDDLIIAGTSSVGGDASNNLGSGDVIDGGEGFDTLRIIDTSGDTLTPNMSNVERLDIQALDSLTTINLTNTTGLEEVRNFRSSETVRVSEIQEKAEVGIVGSNESIFANFASGVDFEGSADLYAENAGVEGDSATIYVSTDDSANITELNIESMGAANFLNVDIDNQSGFSPSGGTSAALETLNITGMGDLTLRDGPLTSPANSEFATLSLVEAGTFEGDLDFELGTDNDVEELVFNSGSGDDRIILAGATGNLTVNGGAGNDVINVGAVSGDVTVDGGEGDDLFIVGAGSLDENDSFIGGDGFDTLEIHFGGAADLTGDENDIVDAVNASDVESLTIDVYTDGESENASDETIDLDASLFTTVTDFTFQDSLGGTTLEGDITVTEVEDENTFSINGEAEGTASFTAGGASDLNLTANASIDTLAALDFDMVNLTLDGAGDFASDFVATDETTFMVDGTAATLDITVLDNADEAFGDGDNVNEDIVLDVSGVTTEAVDGDTNSLNGSGFGLTIIGTDQDDVIDGGVATRGVTTIDLNALDLDADGDDEDGTDGANDTDDVLQSVTVTIAGVMYTGSASEAGASATAAQRFEAAAMDLASELRDAGFDAEAIDGVVRIVSDEETAVDVTEVTATVDPEAEDVADVTTGIDNTNDTNPNTVTFDEFTAENAGVYTITISDDGTDISVDFDLDAGDTLTGQQIANAFATADDDDNVVNDTQTPGDAELALTGTDGGVTVTGSFDASSATSDDQSDDVVDENGAQFILSADTYTGNDGEDQFVINSATVDGAVTAAGADTITDFMSMDDTISFDSEFGAAAAGTEDNYSEGPLAGFGNFTGALVQATSEFQADGTLGYSAQQVGSDVFIFYNDLNEDNDDDADGIQSDVAPENVVRLTGVSLSDLADDGSFIAGGSTYGDMLT
jgi:hypothetical protein